MSNLKDKVAVVTGGVTGIGRAVCLVLASRGVKIAINHLNAVNEAKELSDNINSQGNTSIFLNADISNGTEVEKMFEQIYDKFGRIDILVNNAGITKDSLLLAMGEKDWGSVININLGGVFLCSKAAAQYMMLQKEGVIVNVSSVTADIGGKGLANYATSKGGINSFTRTMAIELAPKGIRVNAVSPGVIVTKLSEHIRKLGGDKLIESIPMKRFGEPEEVAKVVAFLVSSEASYITGETVHVTGGFGLGY